MLKQRTREEKEQIVLGEFLALTRIPRPSYYERVVSDYLVRTLTEAGIHAWRDEVGNVIAEKAATAGRENDPTIILQAHMDMVCVSADGALYEPTKDAIRTVRDGRYLRADGTSLGADDGIGIAVILAIFKDSGLSHGRLRAIFTVDEESSMTGVKGLDAKYLDADYLINCDSEDVDIITVSSAGSVNVDVRMQLTREEMQVDERAWSIEFRGLLGGHSGVDIDKDRANAILLLAELLAKLPHIRLAHLAGGMARNAIPSCAEAVIVCPKTAAEQIEKTIREAKADFAARYPQEAGMEIVCREAGDAQPLTADCTANILGFLADIPNGVKAKDSVLNLVETSSNLGVAAMTADELHLRMHPRSSKEDGLIYYKDTFVQLAERYEMQAEFSGEIPGWPMRGENRLADLTAAVYERLTGEQMKQEAIHAGLECSYFYQKNPALTMISVGPTVTGVHSPQECVDIPTVVTHLDVLIGVLEELR